MSVSGTDLRRRRRDDLARRLQEGRTERRRCRIAGCTQPATASTGGGLNARFCRSHEDHFERHGSYIKRSYTAAELRQHRLQAERWVRANSTMPAMQRAIIAVKSLYVSAGPCVGAYNLRGLPPDQRARAAWARLRDADVDPLRIVATWLAVESALRADPQPDLRIEFKRVQAAKIVHRMASGTHRRWELERHDGRVHVTELHKYPPSRGRVLRHLGQQIEVAAQGVTDVFVEALTVAHKVTHTSPTFAHR